jgi:hypothetical protein
MQNIAMRRIAIIKAKLKKRKKDWELPWGDPPSGY